MTHQLKTLIDCIVGPRLDSFYKLTGHTLSSTTPAVLSSSHPYKPNSLEAASDYVIRLSKIVTYISAYVSPVLLTYLIYKRNVPGSLFNSLDHSVILRMLTATVSILFGSYCARGFARYSNSEYLSFLEAIKNVRENPSPSNKRILAHFDADFSAYPVEFRWSDASDKRPLLTYRKTFPVALEAPRLPFEKIFLVKIPLDLIMTLVAKTIAYRMIYPGSLSILQTLMQSVVSQGRSRMIEHHGGSRNKLETCEGNAIDTMFIDRRGSSPNGDYLVIGCEGNSSYYEVGTPLTPLQAGYSVLGWNHPGFGGSTGSPFPDQEISAIDVVIKFAKDKLKFPADRIIIYGWSIGGFSASWGAMRHPDISGLIIDASFDHIIPLGKNAFPRLLHPLIELLIKRHFDLDNILNLQHYNGPVLIIRRSQDEIISTDPYNSPPNNRGNYLLIALLKQRFPTLMDDRALQLVTEYLGGNDRYQAGVLRRYSVNETSCLRLLKNYFHTHKTSYPVEIGPELDNISRDQLILFLASKFLIDFDSVHCAPLQPGYLKRPWNLIGIALNSSNL